MPPRKTRKSATVSSSTSSSSAAAASAASGANAFSPPERSTEDSTGPKRQKRSRHWEENSSPSASSLLLTGARSPASFDSPSRDDAGRSLIQEASSATVPPATLRKESGSRGHDQNDDDSEESDEDLRKKASNNKRSSSSASSATRSNARRATTMSSLSSGAANGGSEASASAAAAAGNELVVQDQQSPGTVSRQQGRERPVAQTKNGVRQFVETNVGIRLFLQNCMSTVDLQAKPDLAYIATHARNADFNPKRFPAVFVKLREPKATALVFNSGKMVIIGAQNEDGSRLAAKKMARILQRLGFNVSFNKFTIQNLVGTGDVSFPIRLEGLADEHGRFTSYEPELFAGLVYRMQNPQVVILVYVSGKIVITGARSRGAIVEAFERIYPVLLKYRKNPLPERGTSGASASSAT